MWISPENLYLISFSLIILMKIVCFILSYKIIKLGYNLISAGVKGEFKFSSDFIGFKSDLQSLSPGLLFIVLGVLLMMVAIFTDKAITFQSSKKTAPPVAVDSTGAFNDSTIIPEAGEFNMTDSIAPK